MVPHEAESDRFGGHRMTHAVAYTISPVRDSRGVPIAPLDAHLYGLSDSRRSSAAMSRSGKIAAISSLGPGNASVIRIVRANGTALTLQPPSDAVLTTAFSIENTSAGSTSRHSQTRFRNIVLAEDGTPFATIGNLFSGAYSGVETNVFAWRGRWTIPLGKSHVDDGAGYAIAAVETPDRFVFGTNYLGTFSNVDAMATEPHYQEDQAFLLSRSGTRLGYASVTAMQKRYIVGYAAGEREVNSPQRGSAHSVALEWRDGRETTLGPGIAYGVNEAGDAVGSDDATLGDRGRPTLWRRGTTIWFGTGVGTAFAISDSSEVVGTLDGTAFVADAAQPTAPRRLDDLIPRHDWHVSDAFAIARSGRILGIASERGAAPSLVVLDPIGPRH